MSALPPKADIGTQSWNVRFVPKADILRCEKKSLFDHRVGAGEQRRRPIDVERLGSLACCFAPVARALVRFEFCRTHLARKIGRRHPAKR